MWPYVLLNSYYTDIQNVEYIWTQTWDLVQGIWSLRQVWLQDIPGLSPSPQQKDLIPTALGDKMMWYEEGNATQTEFIQRTTTFI